MLGLIGAVLLIVVVFVDVDRWATRVGRELRYDTGAPRAALTIWRESLPIARDFWLTGSGAGTFSDAMIVYQESRVWVGSMRRWAHFNNAHSHYLQVACEGGLLLGLPVLWALIALARLGYRAVRSDKGEMFWVRIGAAGGLAGLAVQSIWETSLIMPANAVLRGRTGRPAAVSARGAAGRGAVDARTVDAAGPRRDGLADADCRSQCVSRRRRRGGAPRRAARRRPRGRAVLPYQARRRFPGARDRRAAWRWRARRPRTSTSGRSRAAAACICCKRRGSRLTHRPGPRLFGQYRKTASKQASIPEVIAETFGLDAVEDQCALRRASSGTPRQRVPYERSQRRRVLRD